MAQLVAIDNKNHLNLTVDAAKAELHGAGLHLVPAVMSEFTNMAVHYPLVITKNADTGQFVVAAMLGFEAGENLFWDLSGQCRMLEAEYAKSLYNLHL